MRKLTLFFYLKSLKNEKIKQRGEIKLKTPLQTYMEQKIEEAKQINTNSVKEYTLKITVDTTELDEAIKKLKELNKLAKKYEQPKPIFNINGGLSESSVLKIFKVIEEK